MFDKIAEEVIIPKKSKNTKKDYFKDSKHNCILCNVITTKDKIKEHEESELHNKNMEGKYKVVNNYGKTYYYDKSSRKTTKERMKDPVKKEKHYAILKKKVSCDICGSVVAYSALWRHKKSMKCQLYI